MQRPVLLRLVSCLALALAGVAAAASAPPPGSRQAFAAEWQAQGLQPARSSLDLLYLRPGAREGGGPLQVAPVEVQMRRDWQRADRTLEYTQLRSEEVQQLKDEVAAIVADELQQAFASGPVAAQGGTPVLQVRVVDLYLNAPDLNSRVRAKNYTNSYGDMVLVAELRDGPGGRLLLASWNHSPAREFASPRLTTRVENAIEVRAAAHGWARQLRKEIGRVGEGG
jgi:hypothetical protein